MLRIRLSRVGKKKQPTYRIVVADSRAPREGAFLRIIGHYNPRTEPATLVVKEDEAIHWLQRGAQPSETAAKLLTRIGVMERAGRAPVHYQGKEAPPAPKKAAAATTPPAAPASAAAEGEPTQSGEPPQAADAEATAAETAEPEGGEAQEPTE